MLTQDIRFDDRIATALAMGAEHPVLRGIKWRQLVDILAQSRGQGSPKLVSKAFSWLRDNRDAVDISGRLELAQILARQPISADLLIFFAEDEGEVAAPILSGARLGDDEWLGIIPLLPASAKSLLINRDDLSEEVRQALSLTMAERAAESVAEEAEAMNFDFSPQQDVELSPLVEEEPPIDELVERAEKGRRKRAPGLTPEPETEKKPGQAPPPQLHIHPSAIDAFRWETDADGVMIWIEGAPREALIGQSIATIGRDFGADGQAVGAFHKRAPFRDARFKVAGDGAASGDWRISGVPYFEPKTGSFIGYRGTARRPRIDEVAQTSESKVAAEVLGVGIPPDSLRELVHELRTPLNAIVGFAEMIDGQYLGPAGSAYRGRASEIMAQASRLLSAVEDLDTAARLATRRFVPEESSTDAASLLSRISEDYRPLAEEGKARLSFTVAPEIPAARIAPDAAERMFSRLIAGAVSLASRKENIGVSMSVAPLGGRPMLCLSIDRPKLIKGRTEAELLDPGYSPEGDSPAAPVLGLGFALRLVRNLAEATRGALIIAEGVFQLYLPVESASEIASGQGG